MPLPLPLRPPPLAVRTLQSYSYPYNTRELKGLVERAVSQSIGGAQGKGGTQGVSEALAGGDSRKVKISEDLLWFASQAREGARQGERCLVQQPLDLYRVNLLNSCPPG